MEMVGIIMHSSNRLPYYIGGGDLWEEPITAPHWTERVPWVSVFALSLAISCSVIGYFFGS